MTSKILIFTILLSLSAFAQTRYFGANLAGADFGADPDGIVADPDLFNTSYIYPNQDEVDYFLSQEMNVARLPFRWERLQPTLNAPFDAAELARLKGFVNASTAKGMTIILDPHNYARYHGSLIGSSNVPLSAFDDFWRRLASEFANDDHVIFGLMNEPTRMTTVSWRIFANSAIAAIRDLPANNLILVPGNGYTGGHSWLKNFYAEEGPNSPLIGPNGYRVGSNAEEMLNIVDPIDNYAFDVHQYLDSDFSGTGLSCQSATIGSEVLADLTTWLEDNDKKAFVGEFGAGVNPTCLAALADLTSYINDRPGQYIGWAYWAAGPWWGDYFMSLEPLNIGTDNEQDRPQLAALIFTPFIQPILPENLVWNFASGSFQIATETGQSYQLETSTTLDSNSWSSVGATFQGNGSIQTFTNSAINLSSIQRFFRVSVSRP